MRIYIHNPLSTNQRIFVVISLITFIASIIIIYISAPDFVHGCATKISHPDQPSYYVIRQDCIANFDSIINFYNVTFHFIIWLSVTLAFLSLLALIVKTWSWMLDS